MAYCKKCGNTLIKEKCVHCGKNYEQDKLKNLKKKMKRKIKEKYNVPRIKKLVVLIIILALVVIFCYLIFSNSTSNFLITKENKIMPLTDKEISDKEIRRLNQISSQKPSLRIYHQMVNKLDFDRGCFGRVDGGVTNTGVKEATGVIMHCSTQNGISVEHSMGDIEPGETRTFQVFLNYDCSKLQEEECIAICDNC